MNSVLPASRVTVRTVPAAAGALWIRRAFRAYARQPFGFMSLFCIFILLMVLVSLVLSVVGGVLQALHLDPALAGLLAMVPMPLVSLGFMVGTEAALNDLPVRPHHLFTALERSAASRRSLLALGVVYALLAGLATIAGDGLDDGEARRWLTLHTSFVDPQALGAAPALSERGRFVLALKAFVVALGSTALWHAPALVHWGGQRAVRAMFGSVVALWRTRAAFIVYLLAWVPLMMLMSFVVTLVALVTGGALVVPMALMLSLVLSTVFYVSLWFGFDDSFEISHAPPPAP